MKQKRGMGLDCVYDVLLQHKECESKNIALLGLPVLFNILMLDDLTFPPLVTQTRRVVQQQPSIQSVHPFQSDKDQEQGHHCQVENKEGLVEPSGHSGPVTGLCLILPPVQDQGQRSVDRPQLLGEFFQDLQLLHHLAATDLKTKVRGNCCHHR